jgi:NTE family protein
MIKKNIALVFSGGGARGAFQIGAWKALSENNLVEKIGAVYGTSVGAINAAAFVQGDFALAKEIWSQLNYENIFNHMVHTHIKKLSRADYLLMARTMMADRGLKVEPLKELIRDSLHEDKIRKSELDFGVVVYDLTHKKSRYLRKEQIPKGQLIEYVIASATFPLFQPHWIENTAFIDGGLRDNRPLSFIVDRQNIEKIICVDVTIARHFWKNKKPNAKVDVHYLRPSKLLGSPMAFRNERIKRNMNLGYHDAMNQIKSEGILIDSNEK